MAGGVHVRHPHPHQSDGSTGRLLAVVVGVLLTLAALAYAGTIAIDRFVEHRRVVALMGPKPALASLPPMEFELGGPRALDLKISLVLAPKASPRAIEPYYDRISDRLYESMLALGSDGLTGHGAAAAVKRSVLDAVRRETGGTAVRDVYIEHMVVK